MLGDLLLGPVFQCQQMSHGRVLVNQQAHPSEKGGRVETFHFRGDPLEWSAMKVVLLLQDTRTLYGAEQATLRLACGLAAAGVAVRVLLLRETRLGEGRSPLAEAFRQRVPGRGDSGGGRFSGRRCAASGKVMQREGAAVLHSTRLQGGLPCGLGRAERAFSVVGTVHGWLFRWRFKERVFQALNLRALRRFPGVIVLSGFYERYLRAARIYALHVARIPTGVRAEGIATEATEACRLWKAAGPVFTFGMLGRLSSEKKPPSAFVAGGGTAAREGRPATQSWRILVAGEWTVAAAAGAAGRRLGIADRGMGRMDNGQQGLLPAGACAGAVFEGGKPTHGGIGGQGLDASGHCHTGGRIAGVGDGRGQRLAGAPAGRTGAGQGHAGLPGGTRKGLRRRLPRPRAPDS